MRVQDLMWRTGWSCAPAGAWLYVIVTYDAGSGNTASGIAVRQIATASRLQYPWICESRSYRGGRRGP